MDEMTRTCGCGAESRPGSWLCEECAETAPTCESCGVPMIDHPGIYATCAELQQVKAENAKLNAALKAAGLQWVEDVCECGNTNCTNPICKLIFRLRRLREQE